jgi:Cu/Ag efflux protein CusF
MLRIAYHSLVLLFALTISAAALLAQTPQPSAAAANTGISATGVIGEVRSIDTTANQMVVKTDSGALVTVVVSDKTVYKRLPPGEKTLDKATVITSADVGPGDRVWARGRVAADQKSVPAQQLIVTSKADIAKRQEQERADWKKRGVQGVVSALNPATKEITITSRSLMGATQAVVIPVTDKVEMKRYAPDSIKFSDAKASSFDELKIGDQVRALGDRSADLSHLAAEQVVTGSFRIVAGKVTAIDTTAGEVQISDLQTKQPLTVVIKQDAVLRRFSIDPATFGGMGGGGGGGQRGPGAAGGPPQGQGQGTTQGGARPQGGGAGGGQGGPQGSGMRMGRNVSDILENQPQIQLAELKVGDTIVVSSTKGADPTRLTAISLVTGADTLLAMVAPRQPQGARPAGGQQGSGADLSGLGMLGGMGMP